MADIQRRDFLGMSLASVTAIGAIASLVAMKKTWDPLPSVVSAGFTTIDVANMQEGQFSTVEWRGKPVYILKRSKKEGFNEKRDFKIGESVFTTAIQICTHLGCIPTYQNEEKVFYAHAMGGVSLLMA